MCVLSTGKKSISHDVFEENDMTRLIFVVQGGLFVPVLRLSFEANSTSRWGQRTKGLFATEASEQYHVWVGRARVGGVEGRQIKDCVCLCNILVIRVFGRNSSKK